MIDGRVVVVGGTGFVGRHITRCLLTAGAPVTVIGRRRRGTCDSERVRFCAMDLERVSQQEVRRVISGASAVINSTGSIWDRPVEAMVSGIVRPTEVLVRAMEDLSRPPRYVHLGSVLENARSGGSDYGAAKKAASDLVAGSSLDRWIVQVANAVGPGAPASSLLGRAAGQLVGAEGLGARVLQLGTLNSERDFVDVRDVAEAVVAAAGVPGIGQTVPVGSGHAITARSVIEKLVALSGVEAVIERSAHTAGHSQGSLPGVDLVPARRHLGWRPRRSLDVSLHDYWFEFTRKVAV